MYAQHRPSPRLAFDSAAARADRREILVYEKFASLVPVQVAKVHAAFIDEESGAHCIVMDDCMSMEGGEVSAFPYWMMGAEEGFITKMVCDLAVLHGSFVDRASPPKALAQNALMNHAPQIDAWTIRSCECAPACRSG